MAVEILWIMGCVAPINWPRISQHPHDPSSSPVPVHRGPELLDFDRGAGTSLGMSSYLCFVLAVTKLWPGSMQFYTSWDDGWMLVSLVLQSFCFPLGALAIHSPCHESRSSWDRWCNRHWEEKGNRRNMVLDCEIGPSKIMVTGYNGCRCKKLAVNIVSRWTSLSCFWIWNQHVQLNILEVSQIQIIYDIGPKGRWKKIIPARDPEQWGGGKGGETSGGDDDDDDTQMRE